MLRLALIYTIIMALVQHVQRGYAGIIHGLFMWGVSEQSYQQELFVLNILGLCCFCIMDENYSDPLASGLNAQLVER